MTMIKKIAAGTAPVKMDASPFLGGGGQGGVNGGARNVLVHMTPAVGILLEGHDGLDTPDAGDTEWYPLLTGVAGDTSPLEAPIARWVRRGPAGGAGIITLEGVQ